MNETLRTKSDMDAARHAKPVRRHRRYWIKERFNPQFDKPYYVAMGQLSNTAAKKHTRPLYGDNVMHAFDTYKAYSVRLAELHENGDHVQT